MVKPMLCLFSEVDRMGRNVRRTLLASFSLCKLEAGVRIIPGLSRQGLLVVSSAFAFLSP